MGEHDQAIEAIRTGRIVGVPTDTLYGLAIDPFNPDALQRIGEIKGRHGPKPLALLVASLEQAQQLAAFSDRALDLAETHWPGGLTLVLPRLDSVPEWIGDAARRTIGLRSPDHATCLELIEETGPLAVTSANVTGRGAVLSDSDAREVFGGLVAWYVPGKAEGGMASTVLDLTQPTERILRHGPVVP